MAQLCRFVPFFMWSGSPDPVAKLWKLFILRFPGSAGVSPNAAYYLRHGQGEDNLKEQMRLAFAGSAGVPPAAAKQMKKSKSQSKQDDAKTCRTTGARVMLCFSSLRLGFC
jgi:hypothetical protein